AISGSGLAIANTLSPRRRRRGWYLNFHSDQAIRQDQVIAFLRDLLRHVHRHLFLLWDRWNPHRGRRIRSFLPQHPPPPLQFLSAYAPELNPTEYGWSYLKCHTLANYAPNNIEELAGTVQSKTEEIRTHQRLLRGFVKATATAAAQTADLGHNQYRNQ